MSVRVITSEPLRSYEWDMLHETLASKKTSVEQKILLIQHSDTTWFGISLPYDQFLKSELETIATAMIINAFERCGIPYLYGYRVVDIREVNGVWLANPFHLQGYLLMLPAITWPN